MPKIPVRFIYHTGITQGNLFSDARLMGTWNVQGRRVEDWQAVPMQPQELGDHCPSFVARVEFEPDQIGQEFRWTVVGTAPSGRDQCLMMTEVRSAESAACERAFTLQPEGQNPDQVYRFSISRWLGAQKVYVPGDEEAQLQFAVWAPNARAVEVVMGRIYRKQDRQAQTPLNPPGRRESAPLDEIRGGYIADSGAGELPGHVRIPMVRGADGVWVSQPAAPMKFADYEHRPYMYLVTRADGSIAYRSDIHSRCQIGGGDYDPQGVEFLGQTMILDGTRSCSVIVDPDTVTDDTLISSGPERTWPEARFVDAADFWQGLERPVRVPNHTYPGRVEDLVIYELHMGALGFGHINPYSGQAAPGTLEDACALIAYLVDLGVNAVELLPLSEFAGGGANWGYATSHYFAIEYAGGGRDAFKLFVRECHRQGLAVIMDVVFNHYAHNAERAQWMYDAVTHDDNCYYWYEGRADGYPEYDRRVGPAERGTGGYVDNLSTGFAPRYYEEIVRQTLISSAVALVEEFHVDGFRVDQTTSIHGYNVLRADTRRLDHVNAFGGKLLREYGRTLKTMRPDIILMAEDHSTWEAVTIPADQPGGMGFDARWYADFYHHLIGDTDKGSDYAKLLWVAGHGTDEPLAMDYFAGALAATRNKSVVYHESHDEAGNGTFTHRTMVTAVNGAPLVGETRRFAESRCRLVCGMTMLSAGTPMFLFGEEVGAVNDFVYARVLEHREDLAGMRASVGRSLFEFYRAILAFRLNHAALRSRNLDVIYAHNANRVIAWRRWDDAEQFLAIASLNNRSFANGYVFDGVRLPDGLWQEVFNSDAQQFGGDSVGNLGGTLPSSAGRFEAVLPANGLVVLQAVT